MSTVFRVVKNSNYTTLSNYHFKDKRLSWKAKGLLSTMLSLPEDWNYTIEGLAALAGDGTKSTNSGLAELEEYGYLIRTQLRGENGRFGTTEYTIYENPIEQGDDFDRQDIQSLEETRQNEGQVRQPICQNGQTVKNMAFSPICQKRQTEKRITEKGVQLNTNILNTKELNTSSSSPPLRNSYNQERLTAEEEADNDRLRKHFEIDRIENQYPTSLVEMVFGELCKRDAADIQLMTAKRLEQVCYAIVEKEHREPIRILPRLINKYLDNAIISIRAMGGNSRSSPGNLNMPLGQSRFYDFEQHNYDFDTLEKELTISNELLNQ
ncbi:MAG: helix-turn-helix domain-containing protein [Clostridiales bacterium]|nr:helix-turn-helix domain-containing protein [Clostridiales bacterium]